MPWVEKRRRSDRPDDSGDIPGEKRAALVGCRRSGYALSPAAHRLILIVADDLPVGKGMAPVRCASPHPSTAVDMRRGFDSLRVMAQEVLRQDAFSGAVFWFRGRRGCLIKVLYRDGQGFCLFANYVGSYYISFSFS